MSRAPTNGLIASLAFLVLAVSYCQSVQPPVAAESNKTPFLDVPNKQQTINGNRVLPFVPNFKQASPTNVTPKTGNISNKIVSNGDNNSNVLINNGGQQPQPQQKQESSTLVDKLQPKSYELEREQPSLAYNGKPSSNLNQLPVQAQQPLSFQEPISEQQQTLKKLKVQATTPTKQKKVIKEGFKPQIGRAKNMNIHGPVQSGGSSYNVNNNVSKIKIGNTKKTNVNVVNQIMAPTNFGNDGLFGNDDDTTPMVASRFLNSKPKKFVDGKRFNQIRYQPEDDYNQDYNNNNNNNNGFYQDDCVEHCDDDNGQQVGSSDDELHYNGGNGGFGSKYEKKKKYRPDGSLKKSKKATQEQKKLKQRLLELASKAINDPINGEDDVPLLKFNKDTGKYEAVQVDPSTKAYKEKLQAALAALSAKKLPAEKLRRVLEDEDAFPSEVGSDPLDLSRGNTRNPASNYEKNYYVNQDNDPNNYDFDDGEQQFDNSLGADNNEPYPQQYKSGSDRNLNNGASGAYLVTPQDDPRVDRNDLLGQIRAILNDNLNRINDLLYFRPEFLSELLNVDERTELTPVEAEFKRFILCNADERFCNEDLSLFQQRSDDDKDQSNDAASDVNDNSYQQHMNNYNDFNTNNNNNQYGPHQNNGDYEHDYDQDQFEYYSNNYGNGNNNNNKEQSNVDSDSDVESVNNDYNRYQAGNKNYHFLHSAEGAANGVPTKKQAREYAEQSSYRNHKTKPNLTAFETSQNQNLKPSVQQKSPNQSRQSQLNDLKQSGNLGNVNSPSPSVLAQPKSHVGYLHGGSNPDQPYTVGVLKPKKDQVKQQRQSTSNNSSPASMVQARVSSELPAFAATPRNLGRGRSQVTTATAETKIF